MIITIAGLPGSGKSSVAKGVAKKLGFTHYSAGDIQRMLAKERGLTITEWGKKEAEDKSFDLMIEEKTKEVASKGDNIVIDGWLAAFCAPRSIKVFLECDEEERAKRRLTHKREEESFDSIRNTINDMQVRVSVNQKRWLEFYGYDFLDMSNYDLIVNTTNIGIEEVVVVVLEYSKDVA